MKKWIVVLLALALQASVASAANPEWVSPAFDVQSDGGSLHVVFALNLSEVSSYPVTFTAIRGSAEEVLWQGTLNEGVYRITLTPQSISGSGPLTLILKTRVIDRNENGNHAFLRYLRWDGQL